MHEASEDAAHRAEGCSSETRGTRRDDSIRKEQAGV
jgi:hypothetical protein